MKVGTPDNHRLVLAGTSPHPRPIRRTPTETSPGDRFRTGLDIIKRSRNDQPATIATAPRTEVDDPVGLAQHAEIVLDQHHGIALVSEILQARHQAAGVDGVQTDGRFVQHVGHANETRPQRPGQPGSLELATRQASCAAIKRQVVQANPLKIPQPTDDKRQDLLRNDRPW